MKSTLYDTLSIQMVGRNLITLHYPFIEAILSTIPLGCRYVIGDFGKDDLTPVINILDKYIPIEVVKIQWLCDVDLPRSLGYGAVALGKAIQDLSQHSPTYYVLNQQACEVYCDDAIESIYALQSMVPMDFKFRHFYGSMNHGGYGYGGYQTATRLINKDTKFDQWDGCWPNGYGGGLPIGGHINRYGYCHHNTITQKLRNHAALYFDGDPEPKIRGTLALGKTQTWFEGHHECVQHLLNINNYDVNYSLEHAVKYLEKP